MATKPEPGFLRRHLTSLSRRAGQYLLGVGTRHGLYQRINDDGYRRRQSVSDRDIRDLFSPVIMRALIADARYIEANLDVLHGAVENKADWVQGDAWRLQYRGDDDAFRAALRNGFPRLGQALMWNDGLTFDRLPRLLSRLLDVDGDAFLLLTETPEGWPQIQVIEAHRIGQPSDRLDESIVSGGLLRGNQIANGVITNDLGQVLGYRVMSSHDTFRDVLARDTVHVREILYASASRGVPAIMSSMLALYDLRESRNLQRIKQKVNSALTLIEKNATGYTDTAQDIVGGISNHVRELQTEVMEGGMIRTIRGDESLVAHTANDPSGGWLELDANTERRALFGMGWRREALDISADGGAGVRAIQTQLNKAITSRCKTIEPAMMRCAKYILAKLDAYRAAGGDTGLPPLPDDWWQSLSFSMPARFSVDEGRMRQEDREDARAGIISIPHIQGTRGIDGEQVLRDQAEWFERRNAVAESHDLAPELLGVISKPNETLAVIENGAD